MKLLASCSGPCYLCAHGKSCVAGDTDDDFSLASGLQLIERIQSSVYSKSETDSMIRVLSDTYGYSYDLETRLVTKAISCSSKPVDDAITIEFDIDYLRKCINDAMEEYDA